MKQIVLSNGSVTQVSEEDLILLSGWNWHQISKGGYATRCQTIDGKRRTIYMHQVIAQRMGLAGKIDHEDRNKLNNHRSNLREATSGQNAINVDLRTDNTSGYKGVAWKQANQKWVAQISFKKKLIYLGLFDDPREAAVAYNKAATLYFGEFAVLNQLN